MCILCRDYLCKDHFNVYHGWEEDDSDNVEGPDDGEVDDLNVEGPGDEEVDDLSVELSVVDHVSV
jgi:hypothetical protein